MKPFQLLIKPVSADCNMNCGYCFYRRVEEMYPSSRHIMSADALEKTIKDFLSNRFPISVFSWQGGEPTLAGLDFFRQVIEFEKKHGAKGQVIGNSLQTNGVLIDEEWARFLSKYKFLVGISLDGPKEIHDIYRSNHDGSSSWEETIRCADLFRKNDVAFSVLAVVSKANLDNPGKLYRWFIGNGFRSLQFIPCVEVNPETGKISDFSVTPDAYGRFLIGIFEEWKKRDIGRVFVRDFDSILTYMGSGQHSLCIYGKVCNDYIVVEHNGDCYPCDFFVKPDYRLGNLMESSLADLIQSQPAKKFASDKSAHEEVCRSCRWLELCNGGCQKDRITTDGGKSQRSYLCEGYRIFFSHAENELRKIKDRLISVARKSAGMAGVKKGHI